MALSSDDLLSIQEILTKTAETNQKLLEISQKLDNLGPGTGTIDPNWKGYFDADDDYVGPVILQGDSLQ
jgi:hypothetical protein